MNKIWDESSDKAHYKNHPSGKPFFAVFNSVISHESCIQRSISTSQLRHDPAGVILPPYYPDTPEMRDERYDLVRAVRMYISILEDGVNFDMTDRNLALNSVDAINDKSPEIISVLQKMYEDNKSKFVGFEKYSQYDLCMCERLLKKWGVI
jgi:hypothetical protein